jgi:hypothetical protein
MAVDNSGLWDRPRMERLRKVYNDTPGDKDTIFEFDGHEFLKGYVKYLIEYLDSELPPAD